MEKRVDALPFLPGNNFTDVQHRNFKRSHTLNYNNGYKKEVTPVVYGSGKTNLHHNQLSQDELDALSNYNPTLTYGQPKKEPETKFVPSHVALDKKTLHFKGYFKQTVYESPLENYRVRHLDIFYYLEDDSVCVTEAEEKNSGLPQGKFLHRQRIPKNDQGDHYHWTDLNLAMNVCFYGTVIRLTSCDPWTRDFLLSEGVELNPPEGTPHDPYITQRNMSQVQTTRKTPNDMDKLRKFLELDRKVLRYFAVWDDRASEFGEMRPLVLHYYLADDTIEVKEVHKANDGRDPYSILIGRHRVPVDRKDVRPTHPSITLELSANEIKRYFNPTDFAIGQTVSLYGRRVIIYAFDDFTKAYYYRQYGQTDFTPCDVEGFTPPAPQMEVPPYNGFGSIEDSAQNCHSIVPKPPKKDYVKIMELDGKVLRFEAILDSVRSEDRGRRFIIVYYLNDDNMAVYEPPVNNSGIISGKFLEKSRPTKPDCSPEKPVYYTPNDFKIGETVILFRHRFIITGCDKAVLTFLREHADNFCPELIQSIEAKFARDERVLNRRQQAEAAMSVRRTEGDSHRLALELQSQLRKLKIIGKARIDEMFLELNRDRVGFIHRDHLKVKLKSMNLPIDDDILEHLMSLCRVGERTDIDAADIPPDAISLEEFRAFLEQ